VLASHVEDHKTVLTVDLPAHLPVDRIVFAPAEQPRLFARRVRVSVRPLQSAADQPAREQILAEGELLRIHGNEQGQRIDEEQLELSTQSHMEDQPTRWTISIDNGDDAPLAIDSASLEMQERDLCYEVTNNSVTTLYYGDSALAAPHYDYSTVTSVQPDAIPAALDVEQPNPAYVLRPDQRPLTERNPWLLWIGLLGAIGALGMVTLRTLKRKSETVSK
jgi:hypothetical protein